MCIHLYIDGEKTDAERKGETSKMQVGHDKNLGQMNIHKKKVFYLKGFVR